MKPILIKTTSAFVGLGMASGGIAFFATGTFGEKSKNTNPSLPIIYVVVEAKTNSDTPLSITNTTKNYSCSLTSQEEIFDDQCLLTKLSLSSFDKNQTNFNDLINKEPSTFTSSDLVSGNIFKLKVNAKLAEAIDWKSDKTIDLLNKEDKKTKHAILKPLFLIKNNNSVETKTSYWIGKVDGFKDSTGNVKDEITSAAKGKATFTCPFYSDSQANIACTIHNFINNAGALETLTENEFHWSENNYSTNIEKGKFYVFKSIDSKQVIEFNSSNNIEKDVESNIEIVGTSSGKVKKIKVTNLKPAVVFESTNKNFIFFPK